VERFKAFIPVLGMPKQRKRQLMAVGGNLMSFDLLWALWREKDVDVVHTHALGRIGGIALTLAKTRHVPFVVTIHGGVLDLPAQLKSSFNAPVERGWEWGRLFGLLLQSRRLFVDADAILTCNAKEAALLREQLPGKRVVVQPHGVPLEVYAADQREAAFKAYPQLSGRQVLLCLGRIDPVKNQAWLLQQSARIFEQHPNAIMVFAGPCTDEPYGQLVNDTITWLGLEQKVLLTGGLASDDPRLIGLLQAAEVLLLPSVSETFGLVILEAWAAGTTVISAYASGPGALVQSGRNGWLFDLEKPEGFHQALDWTLAHPDSAKEMACRGAEVTRQYSVNALADKMNSLYQELREEKQCAT
jgi:glycosyltransferase involved in cell wall biosynthesis